jgi:hypothetical protein
MAISEDPTQGNVGEHRGEDPTGSGTGGAEPDPTQGREVGTGPSDDPSQGREVGETPYEDPSQGREVGELPGEDPSGPAI